MLKSEQVAKVTPYPRVELRHEGGGREVWGGGEDGMVLFTSSLMSTSLAMTPFALQSRLC